MSAGGVRHATGTFSRRKISQNAIEGAPFGAGDQVLGRYVIKEAVAEGPLGFVFRAQDKDAGGEVALKAIHPRLLQTHEERLHFFEGIRLCKKVSHPNVARVLDDGLHGESPIYTLPFLEGLSLRRIIDLRSAKKQFFSLEDLEPILAQIVSALEAIHLTGPHSDLKPQNILVLPDLLKISDVGLGLAMPRLPFVQAMRAKKADVYLAPEFVAQSEVDIRIDVYSLGVLLGEMLCGQVPHGVVPEILNYQPHLPSAIEGVYRKSINANPQARFKTPGEVLAALEEVSAQMRATARPPPFPEPAAGRLAPPVADVSSEPIDISSLNDVAIENHGPSARASEELKSRGELLETVRITPPPPRKERPQRKLAQRMGFWAVLFAGLLFGASLGYWVLQKLQMEAGPRAPNVPSQTAQQRSIVGPATMASADASVQLMNLDLVDAGEPTLQVVPAEAKATTLRCPSDMKLIDEGPFRMGTHADDPDRGFDERNQGTVSVSAFCIDVYEFPNVKGGLPLTGVSWLEASRQCEAKGKRLCSEEEWEKTCKGLSQSRFPYGDTFDSKVCNTEDEFGEDRALVPSGQFSRCKSGYGVFDLSGNASEWTLTPYVSSSDRAIKGGSFNRPDYAARCSARKNGAPDTRSSDVGFRCCLDAR